MSGQFHARWKYLHCPLTGRLNGPHSKTKHFEEETDILFFPGVKSGILGRAAQSPVNLTDWALQVWVGVYS